MPRSCTKRLKLADSALQVAAFLGAGPGRAVGPSGESHWDHVTDEIKEQAEHFLRSAPCKIVHCNPWTQLLLCASKPQLDWKVLLLQVLGAPPANAGRV